MRWRMGARCGPRARLVLACRAHDHDAERAGVGGELAAGVALLADEELAAACRTSEELERHLALAAGGIGEREGARRAVGSGQQVQAKAPEEARVGGAAAVAGRLSERRTLDRLTAGGAGHRGRVARAEGRR